MKKFFIIFNPLLILSIACISLSGLCKRPPEENFLEPVNVSNNPGRSENPSIAVDSKGTVHLVWGDRTPGNEEILYAFKPKGGNWSTPVNLTNNSLESRFPCIAVDKNDVIHLAWQDASPDGFWRIFYSQKPPEGNWLVPETITGDYMYVCPKLAVQNTGEVHLVWRYGGYRCGLRYAMRTKEGIWTAQTTVIEPCLSMRPAITVDDQRNVHLILGITTDDYLNTDIYYLMKPENGEWSETLNISKEARKDNHASSGGIIADIKGNIHITWKEPVEFPKDKMVYQTKRADGTWSDTVTVCTLSFVNLWKTLAKGPNDELYIPGTGRHKKEEKYYYLLYLTKPQSEEWSDTLICGVLIRDPYHIGFGTLICDNEGRLYFVGEFIGEKGEWDIYCIEYKETRRKKW